MKYIISKEKLYELFIEKNMKRIDVANYFGCSDANIKKKLQKYGIKKPFTLECKNKERKVIVKCLYCNKEYKTQKFRTESQKYTSNYCGYSCAQKSRYLGEEHKQKVRNEIAARRRARIRNQSPELNNEEQQRMKNYYLKCPKGYEVDHIIPLAKGGLHHPDNLQILSMSENRKKGCK